MVIRDVFHHTAIVVKGIGPVSWRNWIFKGILGSVCRIGMGPGFWIPESVFVGNGELWKDPDYMVVSVQPLYIDASFDISNTLILSWHNLRFNIIDTVWWSSKDTINLNSTLSKAFDNYGRVIRVLIRNIDRYEKYMGKAFKNGMCTDDAYIVVQAGAKTFWDPIYGAQVIAREIGHLMGFDDSQTRPATVLGQAIVRREALPTSYDSCNIKRLIDSPLLCLLDGDQNITGRRTCCNPTTCKFADESVQCADGHCCDNCKFTRGQLCRLTDDECDIPDFCPGNSPYVLNDAKLVYI
ncbi:hypothetical protein RF11_10258 [Thelohanellus kitauei]|uniref:Disintegrin domain-containing protein n=1 Tax=Thelohanellus kitauei TaxID=669202 RepID=A0A0C2N783_THEKT|nr:hypothetical protein RF11_10258 [Thelohanellus kitauei]